MTNKAPAPKSPAPKSYMGYIIAGVVVVIIIIVVVVLWKTGVFKKKDTPSSNSSDSSLSENAMNIKNFFDDVFSGSCPDSTTKMAKYIDSIGGFKGVKGSCPEGTQFSMKLQNPDLNSQYDVCVMNADAIQKMNNAPQEIQDLSKNCKSGPKGDDKIKRSEPACNCPQGSRYVSGGLPSRRCINDSTKQFSEESCNCPDGFTYLVGENDPSKRCALLNNKIESHDGFSSGATILK